MPATSSPARSANSFLLQGSPTSGNVALNGSDIQSSSLLPSHAVADDAPLPPKKRRAPNAFIVFRSCIIANKLYPPHLKHQSDVSCYVAEIWRAMTTKERSAFFKMAEGEKLRMQHEYDSPLGAPNKKRKSKSRRISTSTARKRSLLEDVSHGESSPSSDAVVASPSLSISLSSSPMSIPAPSSNLFTLPLRDAVTSSPLAPQPIHAIPTHLLNWGREVDDAKNDALEPSELEPAWIPSHPSPPSQIPCQSDDGCFNSLDVEMPNFWPPFEMSLDFMATLFDTPPFGVYPPL